MRLRSSLAKAHGSGAHHERASEHTYARIQPHLDSLGVTRLANVTGFDRLGIPVYNAVVPRADDTICVYHGKGRTVADARTSAAMEAIERTAAALPLRPAAVAAYDRLVAEGHAALRPGDLNIALLPHYRDDLPIRWLTGHDLLAGEPVLVPYGAVSYVDHPGAPPCYALTTSNGLAAGNSLEEAVCHALCEVIERDALTVADVLGSGLATVLPATPLPRTALDPDTLPPPVADLAARFRAAGVDLRLESITHDIGIPTVIAHGWERRDGGAIHHRGLGTHPDREVALVRAVTECAQGRVVAPGTALPGPPPPPDRFIAAADLPTYPSGDVVADIDTMLGRLRACGLTRVIAVDLSPPGVPVHVVRVLVPGMESWAIDRSRIGERATRVFNDAAGRAVDGAGRVLSVLS